MREIKRWRGAVRERRKSLAAARSVAAAAQSPGAGAGRAGACRGVRGVHGWGEWCAARGKQPRKAVGLDVFSAGGGVGVNCQKKNTKADRHTVVVDKCSFVLFEVCCWRVIEVVPGGIATTSWWCLQVFCTEAGGCWVCGESVYAAVHAVGCRWWAAVSSTRHEPGRCATLRACPPHRAASRYTVNYYLLTRAITPRTHTTTALGSTGRTCELQSRRHRTATHGGWWGWHTVVVVVVVVVVV